MVIALCLQSVAVVDRQATFTDTSTRISSMVIALCPQSVAVVDRQATFTDTSTRISSMVIALYLQSWLFVPAATWLSPFTHPSSCPLSPPSLLLHILAAACSLHSPPPLYPQPPALSTQPAPSYSSCSPSPLSPLLCTSSHVSRCRSSPHSHLSSRSLTHLTSHQCSSPHYHPSCHFSVLISPRQRLYPAIHHGTSK